MGKIKTNALKYYPTGIVKEFDYQIGKTNALRDKKRIALPPGKRVSKNGKEYWESRTNRSDKKGSAI